MDVLSRIKLLRFYGGRKLFLWAKVPQTVYAGSLHHNIMHGYTHYVLRTLASAKSFLTTEVPEAPQIHYTVDFELNFSRLCSEAFTVDKFWGPALHIHLQGFTYMYIVSNTQFKEP